MGDDGILKMGKKREIGCRKSERINRQALCRYLIKRGPVHERSFSFVVKRLKKV